MWTRQVTICQQFEQSDRSGQALWWPIVAPGDPASDCLVLLEGNGRYALTFLHDQWSVRDGECVKGGGFKNDNRCRAPACR